MFDLIGTSVVFFLNIVLISIYLHVSDHVYTTEMNG